MNSRQKPSRFSFRRLLALTVKESLQVTRDPSTLLIAFVLPVVLLFLFAYAVSLDIRNVRIGVVLESDAASAQSLAAAFSGTRYFSVTPARDRRLVASQVVAGELKGYVVIPPDFEQRLRQPALGPAVQIITDGAQPNNAGFVANYAQGVVSGWLQAQGLLAPPAVEVRSRFWYNPEIESRRFLVPGSIAIVMAMIRLVVPGPRSAITTSATRSSGNASMISSARWITLSTERWASPEASPITMPATSATTVAVKPNESESAAP